MRLVTVAVVAATVLAVVLVSDGDNDNIETTGTTRTTLGGAPPAVHEAAAKHDTGADDGAHRHGEAFGRALTARSGQGSRAHPQGRRLTSVLDGPEATPEVFSMSNEGRAVSTPLDS